MSYSENDIAKLLAANPDLRLSTSVTDAVMEAAKAKPTTIRLTLAYGPSANRYWRVYNNRVVRSKAATKYKAAVGKVCEEQGIQPLLGALRVTLDFYRPQKSGDLDNFLKILIDSLRGHAYADDKQIVEIHARRFDDKNRPRVEITIEGADE